MPNIPQEFPFRMVAGTALEARLDARCWGVYVSNYTAQWVEIPDANEFVPPNTRQVISLPGSLVAKARFASPPGVVQPLAVAAQAAILTYTEREVQPSGGVVGAAALASVATAERFTKGTLPAAGNTGRIVLLTDYDRGLWKDTGTSFVSVESEVFNVKQFGCLADGITDDAVNFQAALTAAGAVASTGTVGAIVITPPGNYLLKAALTKAANVALIGAGIGSTTLRFDGAHDGIQELDAGPSYGTDGVIRDMQIVGQNGALVGINVTFRQKVLIDRVFVTGFTNPGIKLDNTVMAAVEHSGLGSNGSAGFGQLEVDRSTTFHWRDVYISGSAAGTLSGLRIDRTGPFSIIGGAIESSTIPLQLCGKAEAVSGVGPGVVHGIDLENPNNGAVTYIEMGAGWTGGAGGAVRRVAFSGVTTSISGSTTVANAVRASNTDTIFFGQCGLSVPAPAQGVSLFELLSTQNLRWSLGINGGNLTVGIAYVRVNGAARVDASQPNQPWESDGRAMVYQPTTAPLNTAAFSTVGESYIKTNSTIATTITNITGGVDGQILYLLSNDVNTTVAHLAGGAGQITLIGGANLLMTGGMVLQFLWDAALAGWRQVRGT